jgi:hypothetical protein
MAESTQSQRATIFGAILYGRQGLAFVIRICDGWGWPLPRGAGHHQKAEA